MRNVVAVCLVLFAWNQSAHASPLLELSGGFGGMGALQARHTGPSAASAYFNPALLTRADPGVSFGVLVLHTNVGIQLGTRSAENAVPDLTTAFHADGRSLEIVPLPTDYLQNGRAADALNPELKARPRQGAGSGTETLTYVSTGIVVKLFKDRLAMGFYGLLPVKNFVTMRSFYVDEQEQYFSNSLHPEMYGDRMTAISVAFGAGVRITDQLSLGLGATLGLVGKAFAPTYVADAGRLNNLQLNTDIKADMALVPHLGVAWDPGKRWHLTGTAHAPQRLDIVAGFQFLLAGGVEQGSGLSFTYFYQPWQVAAGLGYDFYVHGDSVWSATGSLLYARWSKYIDRQSMRPGGAYEWSDTLTGALGVRMQEGPLAIALDGQYKPTPVPEQTGRTNYVDNDRFGMTLALEYGFEVFGNTMKVGAQLQAYRLIDRRQRKYMPPIDPQGRNLTPQLVADETPDDAVISDVPVEGREGLQTNNPGWPDYSSVGWVSTGGLYISVAL